MLIKKYSNMISNSLLPIELIKPYPRASNRDKWDSINNDVKDLILERARIYENIKLRPLKASILLDSISTGNNNKCVEIYNEKINALISLTLAECIENRDKYTESILNIAWSILDMAIWYIPNYSDSGSDFTSSICDTTKYILDLSSTTIGFVLTYSYLLLKEKFDQIDINIGKRFKFEIERRIIKPFIEQDKFHCVIDEKKNNIAKLDCLRNILMPFLIFTENYETRHAAVKKSMELADTIIDSFLKNNEDDIEYNYMFYCSLLKYLDTMYMASGSVFDVFDEMIITKMEELIISSGIHRTMSCNVSLIKSANYTNNKILLKNLFGFYSSVDYINMLKKDIPIDDSLFTIFNYDAITSGFYV